MCFVILSSQTEGLFAFCLHPLRRCLQHVLSNHGASPWCVLLLASPGLHRLQLLDSSATPRGTLAVLMPLLLLAGIASITVSRPVSAPTTPKGCQLLRNLQLLIRREMIFKEPGRWPARWLVTLSLRFAAMGEYYQIGASLGNYLKQLKQSPKKLYRKKQSQEFCSILVE